MAFDSNPRIPRYIPPSPPSAEAEIKGVQKAAKEELLVGPIEISDIREVDNGLGRYLVCVAGRRATGEIGYYSTYFENEDYKGVRPSVIYDFCERQSYRPMD